MGEGASKTDSQTHRGRERERAHVRERWTEGQKGRQR